MGLLLFCLKKWINFSKIKRAAERQLPAHGNQLPGHMNILPGYKLCRKKLHQYPADKRTCPECHKASQQRWREQNPDQQRELNRLWRQNNRERQRENCRRWRRNNFERQQELNRLWSEKNFDRKQEYRRNYYEKNCEREKENSLNWQKKNLDKKRATDNRRRALKKDATPPWADQAAINAIYTEALRVEQETGVKHHVDHIYPLQSDYMCGLHVAENLQVLPGAENIKKGNRIWPGQLDCQRLPLHLNGFTSD